MKLQYAFKLSYNRCDELLKIMVVLPFEFIMKLIFFKCI